MPVFQIFSQSDYLIQIVDINSHTEWQTVQIQISWLLRSQLIWIYAAFKSSVYPGSAGQGLKCCHTTLTPALKIDRSLKEWDLRAMNTLTKLKTAEVSSLLGQPDGFGHLGLINNPFEPFFTTNLVWKKAIRKSQKLSPLSKWRKLYKVYPVDSNRFLLRLIHNTLNMGTSRKHAYIVLTPLNPISYSKTGVYRGRH